MVRPRLVSFSTLAALALAGAFAWAPFALSQDEDSSDSDRKVGTREQKTMEVDWDALRRESIPEPPLEPAPPPPPDGNGGPEPSSPLIAGFPREKLKETRLPVLLPRDREMVQRMRMFAERDRYVASLREEDFSVQIMGTRVSQGSLKSKGAKERIQEMSDAEGYIYQRSEYGCELSFNRYNVSYNISVECRDPQSDPRCTGKDYVMRLAKSLVYVGGMPESENDE